MHKLNSSPKSSQITAAVPIGDDEERRLKILRESTILDSSTTDPSFDRYTSLCRRLFNVFIFCLFFYFFKFIFDLSIFYLLRYLYPLSLSWTMIANGSNQIMV